MYHHFLINDVIYIKILHYVFCMFVTHTARVSTNENFQAKSFLLGCGLGSPVLAGSLTCSLG